MMKNIFDTIRRFFKRKRQHSAADIEKKLPTAALAALKAEAEFLRNTHGVAVQVLAAGEKPSKPKAADAAVEQNLSTLA